MLKSPLRHFLTSVFILLFGFFQANPAAAIGSKNEYVVLVHGILIPSEQMEPLKLYLETQGYDVLNIEYPSTSYPIATLIDMTAAKISKQIPEKHKGRKVNFVGYSLGGLIVRGIVTQHRPAQLGRVVLIAPPNHGSEQADFFKNNPIFKDVFGPAGQESTTHNIQSLQATNLFGPVPVNYVCGIIAGDVSDPLSYFLFKGSNDATVSVQSAKLAGMTDFIVVHNTHVLMPFDPRVQMQVSHFLEKGSFSH